MANNFAQIYIQLVFAVKGRRSCISKEWKNDLYDYMGGIISKGKQKPIIINGVRDHIHLLIGFRANLNLADLIRDVKSGSSKFINDRRLVFGKFEWQSGYGAFSYSRDQIDKVYQYILNQEDHHKKVTFRDEYIALLKSFEVEFNEKYLFDWMED